MEPVSDFKLLSWWLDHKTIATVDRRPFAANPPHPRLADTSLGWWDEQISNHLPCYQGRLLDGLFMMGNALCLQLRTSHGFLLMNSSAADSSGMFHIAIYYVLSDFQGCDWGLLHGREKETPLEWTRRVVFKQWPRWGKFPPPGPDPLRDFCIEDERNLAFKVHRYGWYRLTLFERDPRRCLLSNWRFEHVNSYWQQRRYFCVRKIWGRYQGEDAALSGIQGAGAAGGHRAARQHHAAPTG